MPSRAVPQSMNHPPTPSQWRARRLLPALIACGLWLAAPALADEYAEVQRLQRAGQSSEALARADQYIGAHPRDPQMRFIKANVLTAAGRDAEAQALLQQLTLDYPELAEPWNNLAVLHAGKGQLDLAQQAL